MFLHVNPYYGSAGKSTAWPRFGLLEECQDYCFERATQVLYCNRALPPLCSVRLTGGCFCSMQLRQVVKDSVIDMVYLWLPSVSSVKWKWVCVCGPLSADARSMHLSSQEPAALDFTLPMSWKHQRGAVGGVCSYQP